MGDCKICGNGRTALVICDRCRTWLAQELMRLLPARVQFRAYTIAAHAEDLEAQHAG